VNIPKKYGGQLEFAFGDMPILDPALEKVLSWEGDRKDFPQGPMYWVHRDGKPEMEAIARGTVDEKERKESVCVVKKLLRDDEDLAPVATNGHAVSPTDKDGKLMPLPDSVLLNAPTAPPSAAASTTNLTAIHEQEKPVVQAGEVVPASRPEPVSFVTAQDGLNELTLNEKSGNLANGTANGGHVTDLAPKLDPAVNGNGNVAAVPIKEEVAA
jgi:hypothetical protein